MVRLRMMRCTRPGDIVDKLPELVDHLSSFGEPLLRTGLNAQQAIIKNGDWSAMPQGGERARPLKLSGPRALWGEIFVRDNGYYGIALKKRNPEHSDLFLYEVTGQADVGGLDTFATLVSNVLKINFTPYRYASQDFDRVRTEVAETFRTPSLAEIKLSRLLVDRQVRSTAIAVKQAGGLLLSDVPKQLKGATTDHVRSVYEALTNSGLVTSEIVVLCKNVSRQVLRVPSAEALSSVASAGGRCACGRRLDEERQEQAISLTDLGAGLLDKSRWLSVLVYDELVSAGVAPERIIVEGTLGGDEVDCVAEVSGDLCLFELKDKEFNLGEAYSFGAKIGILSPDYALIVTTAKVGGDAKQHLQRALKTATDSSERWFELQRRGVTGVQYIEGIENLSDDIGKFVSDIEAKDARRVLQQILDSVSLGADRLMQALSDKKPARVPRARKAQPSKSTTASHRSSSE